jgi:hypothetical protein
MWNCPKATCHNQFTKMIPKDTGKYGKSKEDTNSIVYLHYTSVTPIS